MVQSPSLLTGISILFYIFSLNFYWIKLLFYLFFLLPPPSGDMTIKTALVSNNELGSYLTPITTSVPSNPSYPAAIT